MAAATEDACKAIGLNPPIYRRRMDFYLNDAAFDSHRAQEALDWEPKVDLAEGFAATLNSSRRGEYSSAIAGLSLAFYIFGLLAGGL